MIKFDLSNYLLAALIILRVKRQVVHLTLTDHVELAVLSYHEELPVVLVHIEEVHLVNGCRRFRKYAVVNYLR